MTKGSGTELRLDRAVDNRGATAEIPRDKADDFLQSIRESAPVRDPDLRCAPKGQPPAPEGSPNP